MDVIYHHLFRKFVAKVKWLFEFYKWLDRLNSITLAKDLVHKASGAHLCQGKILLPRDSTMQEKQFLFEHLREWEDG